MRRLPRMPRGRTPTQPSSSSSLSSPSPERSSSPGFRILLGDERPTLARSLAGRCRRHPRRDVVDVHPLAHGVPLGASPPIVQLRRKAPSPARKRERAGLLLAARVGHPRMPARAGCEKEEERPMIYSIPAAFLPREQASSLPRPSLRRRVAVTRSARASLSRGKR